MMEREPVRLERDQEYRAEMEAIGREYEKNPAYRALWNMWRRQRRESTHTLNAVGNTALAAHHEAQQLGKLAEELGDVKEWKSEVDATFKITKWILGFVIAATLGSVVVIATKIYGWGMSTGEMEQRVQRLEHELSEKHLKGTLP